MLLSLAPAHLKERRQALRSQRRWQLIQSVWQILFISSLAGGLCWFVALPEWDIATEKQVTIEGNKLIPQDKILSILSLSYPQSIWQVKTHHLKTQLLDSPPIVEAAVTREVFPPQLKVKLKERQPVAIATSTQGNGFLDADGVFIPQSFYDRNASELKQLNLQVIGFDPRRRSDWVKLYPLINNSPVKIFAVDWSDSSNLVLKTELGAVHFGAYSSQLAEKLSVLARMKKLSSKVPAPRVVYIDLTNQAYPTVKLKPEAVKP